MVENNGKSVDCILRSKQCILSRYNWRHTLVEPSFSNIVHCPLGSSGGFPDISPRRRCTTLLVHGFVSSRLCVGRASRAGSLVHRLLPWCLLLRDEE